MRIISDLFCFSSSNSQSHFTTDGRSVGQSVSQSLAMSPSRTYDQIFVAVKTVARAVIPQSV
jgi:hypothetical protein